MIMKPNQKEDEYIWVQEMQLRMAKLAKEQQAESEAEKRHLKLTHWMHCPKCGQKSLKLEGGCMSCMNPDCGYSKCDE